jgi:hypothetical protein
MTTLGKIEAISFRNQLPTHSGTTSPPPYLKSQVEMSLTVLIIDCLSEIRYTVSENSPIISQIFRKQG